MWPRTKERRKKKEEELNITKNSIVFSMTNNFNMEEIIQYESIRISSIIIGLPKSTVDRSMGADEKYSDSSQCYTNTTMMWWCVCTYMFQGISDSELGFGDQRVTKLELRLPFFSEESQCELPRGCRSEPSHPRRELCDWWSEARFSEHFHL